MKDSSAKSRLSDEGVRKKEPSVSKIETKELSEPKLKPSQPKTKIYTLGTTKNKSVKQKDKKSVKNKKLKPPESVGKSPIMRKKTVDNSFVAKASPKTESIKKESNLEKEKSAVKKNADASFKDVEIELETFAISKIPEKKNNVEKLDAKKESNKVAAKKKSTGISVVPDESSSKILEKKNNTQKGDVKKESVKFHEKQSACKEETRKDSSTKVANVTVPKERRKRLSLKEEKLLLDSRKAEKKPELNQPTVSKESSEVTVDSAVTVVDDIVIPVKKSRERKKSFKARELLIQHTAKTSIHANQTKDINQTKDHTPTANLSKLNVAIESTPVKVNTDNLKVTSNSPEKKEPAAASPMIKFTYEKPLKQESESSTIDTPPTDSLPDKADILKSPEKHNSLELTLSNKPPDTEPTQTMTEFATDIERQLQALEDESGPEQAKVVPSLKEGVPTTPVKTDTPEGFQPGARMEALEISTNKWYGVKVVEVDWAENEVLIHFEKWSQRFDEWIQMDSSRLRPCEPREPLNEKLYHVGETVMATWMNSQKYPAKVKKMLNNDFLEVLFFDGFTKTMRTNKIAKCVGNEGLEPILPPPPPPALMSKVERRERKRKIQSVAELFHMKKKKYKTKKSDALGIEAKCDSKPDLEETLSKQKNQKYTDLTNISDNEGEKTYIDLNTSFTQDDGEMDLSESKGENDTLLPAVPTKRPYKRKKFLNATTDISSPESGSAKEGIFPFKGRKTNEAMGSDYDSWEPDGEEAYVVETADGLRRSLVVKDDRLPAGWAKHTIQRRSGNSAGKWDVFLVSPGGRRFRSRKEMQVYFADIGEEYRPELFDFTLRCNMRRKCDDTLYVLPNDKRRTKHLTLRKHKPTLKLASSMILDSSEADDLASGNNETPQRKYKIVKQAKGDAVSTPPNQPLVAVSAVEGITPAEPVAEGTVFIGNLQVQLDPAGAYVCPSVACEKHFRRENLLQMHIKHYHPELSAFVGTTPNVADLAYARTVGTPVEDMGLSGEYFERLHRVEVARKLRLSSATLSPPSVEKKLADKKISKSTELTPGEAGGAADRAPAAAEPCAKAAGAMATSTPLRDLLRKESALPREQLKAGVTAGIKTLLPIVRTAAKPPAKDSAATANAAATGDPWTNYPPSPSDVSIPGMDGSYHKQKSRKRRLSDAYMDGIRKRKHLSSKPRLEENSCDLAFSPSSDESSFLTPNAMRVQPGSMKKKNPLLSASLSRPLPDYVGIGLPSLLANSPSPLSAAASSPVEPLTEEQLNKRDIINCTCGVMEEDGLMIQCDLCLCWQHGYCNNIERENEVPDKYVCYICQHPARERMSTHYLHDQDWLNEGVLPSLSERTRDDPVVANRTALLRKSHGLAAGLLKLQTAIKSLRVKVNVANTPDHPKLYLWTKPWEKSPEPKPDHAGIEPNLLNHVESSLMSAKVEHPSIEQNLLNHTEDSLMSMKDESELEPVKLEVANGQFTSDVGGDLHSGAANLAHGASSEKEMPKMPEGQTAVLDVKEEVEDAGYLGSECKTELESVDAVDVAESKPSLSGDGVAITAEGSPKAGERDEKPPGIVPTEAGEAMDVDESKEAGGLDRIEMPNPIVQEEAKESSGGEPSGLHDHIELQTQVASTPLMDGVASTSSQVPLIESSLLSKQFNTDKSGSELDTHLLLQALTHGNHEPAMTNGTDLSNGHLDASQLLNFPISKMELLRFANSIADNFKAAAVINHPHPRAPEPEKPIDPRECRLLLLDHIELKQREVKHQLEILEDQLAVLEAEDPEPPGEETLEFFPQTKQTVKMLLRDLNTLKKISEIN